MCSCFVYGIYWVYVDCRLLVHAKGPWFGPLREWIGDPNYEISRIQ